MIFIIIIFSFETKVYDVYLSHYECCHCFIPQSFDYTEEREQHHPPFGSNINIAKIMVESILQGKAHSDQQTTQRKDDKKKNIEKENQH